MSARAPVIYEVTLEIDPRIVVDYDTWLEAHLRRVLEQDGFESGHVYRADPADDGWHKRIVQYHVRSAADLDRYLEHAAPALQAEGLDRWGTRFRATRRVLRPASELATPSASDRAGGETVTECPNCGSLNIEKFCANCGQDNRVSVVAFPRLVADLLTDLFNFDSRMFGSLWPLLARPGALTKEFLAGRRASFLPPVRMYLFLSLFFFGIVAWIVPNDIKIDDQKGDGETATEVQKAHAKVEPGIIKPKRHAPDAATAIPPAPAPASEPDDDEVDGFGIIRKNGKDTVHLTDDKDGFLKRVQDRATANLQRLDDDGKEGAEYRAFLLRKGIGNLPWMMFLLLPVYAFFLKLLYIRSGRYYVEHLIYSLHLHAFVFLTLGTLFAWLGGLDAFGYRSAVHGLVWAAWWTYFFAYPWRAMKRVYGQGWFKTTAKYLILGTLYVVLLVFGIAIAAIYTLST